MTGTRKPGKDRAILVFDRSFKLSAISSSPTSLSHMMGVDRASIYRAISGNLTNVKKHYIRAISSDKLNEIPNILNMTLIEFDYIMGNGRLYKKNKSKNEKSKSKNLKQDAVPQP